MAEQPGINQGRLIPASNRYLNETEAAQLLGVSLPFLRQRRCYGALPGQKPGPPFMKFGRAVRYSLSDLEAWAQSNRVNPQSAA